MKQKIFMHLAGAVILLSLAISSFALAQDIPRALNDRQQEILRTVRAVDGYVDENLHREFWQMVPETVRETPEFLRLLSDMQADTNGPRQNFQRHAWLSARASLEAGRVVRTLAYTASLESVRTASTNPEYIETIENSIASAERLLFASATGQPLDVPGGRTFVTEDLIEQVLSGIEASEFRFAKLVSPTWDGTLFSRGP